MCHRGIITGIAFRINTFVYFYDNFIANGCWERLFFLTTRFAPVLICRHPPSTQWPLRGYGLTRRDDAPRRSNGWPTSKAGRPDARESRTSTGYG